MGKISFAISASTIVIAYDGKSFRIPRKKQISEDVFEDTITSQQIIQAIHEGKMDSETSPIPGLVDIQESFKNSPFYISEGQVYIDGVLAPPLISKKIMEYKEMGIPYNSIVEFHRNVLKNPSPSAREELFLFLEHNGHPFTEEGYFLAYKAVRPDFYSKYNYHEGSKDNILNAPQTWVEMPRSDVDGDRNRTCSHGLHCANYDYAKNSYGSSEDLLISLIVDPKDVVAVPSDYRNMKMRVCRYFVVGPCEGETTKTLYTDWNQSLLVNNNAPTNMVREGDSEDLDNKLIDAIGVDISVNQAVEPKVEVDNAQKYYLSYVNGVGITWVYNGYDRKTDTLTFVERAMYSRTCEIVNGNKVPVSWTPSGREITDIPKKKVESLKIVPSDNFADIAKKYIGTLSLPTATAVKVPTKPVAVKANKSPVKPKVDTTLNYLSQPRVNGRFVKKNP